MGYLNNKIVLLVIQADIKIASIAEIIDNPLDVFMQLEEMIRKHAHLLFIFTSFFLIFFNIIINGMVSNLIIVYIHFI